MPFTTEKGGSRQDLSVPARCIVRFFDTQVAAAPTYVSFAEAKASIDLIVWSSDTNMVVGVG